MYLKYIIKLLTLTAILQNQANALLDRNLIVDYFKIKPVGRIVLLSCENKTDIMSLTKFLMNNTFYTSAFNYDFDQINITKILRVNTYHDHFGIVLDADCKRSTTLLIRCANNEKFGDKFKWLIFSTNNKILQMMGSININVNSEITVVSTASDKSYWKLLEVYNPGFKHGGTLKVHNMGTWTLNDGFNLNKNMSVLKYWRRKDLSEVTLKGTIVLIDKFPGELLDYLYNNDQNRHVDTFNRFQFILWSYIRDFYNFTLVTNLRHVWGKQLKNGSHIGMIGALQRKEIDMGLSPTFYKDERIGVLDFLAPTFTLNPCFIFRSPKPEFTIRGAFFSPLSSIVWLATWGIMLLTMIIMRLCFYQEWKLEDRNIHNSPVEYDLSYILLLTFGGLCQQDVPSIPNLYSGRIVIFTSVLFTYILYQFYSGGIVSSLLSEPPKTINNLKDLLHSPLQIGIEDIIYEKDFFDQTTDPVALELYRTKVVGKKNGSDAYYKVEHGLKLVKHGGFAFQVDMDVAYKIIAETYSNEIICDLNQVHLYPTQRMTGIGQKNSPFKEVYVYGFQRLIEHGLVYRERIKWTTPKPECIKVVDSSKINVGMNEFFPALLFYMIGIVISFFILLCEIIVNCNTQWLKTIYRKMKK